MQFVKETAKAWYAGLAGALGVLTAASTDTEVTVVEIAVVVLTFIAGWFGAWMPTNAEPTFKVNQPSEPSESPTPPTPPDEG